MALLKQSSQKVNAISVFNISNLIKEIFIFTYTNYEHTCDHCHEYK